MFRAAAVLAALTSSIVFAQQQRSEVRMDDDSNDDTWSGNAHFFMGMRGGVAVPPGGDGLASTVGLELGVSAKQGVGFGLHLIGMQNPPAVQALDIPKTGWGLGAAADVRFYFQTVEPLTLYPTLSAGFVGGTASSTGKNVVLPLINPGFGARMKFDKIYVAFEFGAASFYIPFVNLCIGFEPERQKPARVARVVQDEIPQPEQARRPQPKKLQDPNGETLPTHEQERKTETDYATPDFTEQRP